MNRLRAMPIRQKVMLAVGLVLATGVLVSGTGLLLYQSVTYRARTVNELNAFAEAVAVAVNGPVVLQEPEEAVAALERLRTGSEIVEVHLYSRMAGRDWFASWPTNANPPAFVNAGQQGLAYRPEGIWLMKPLQDQRGRTFAEVALRSELRTLREERQRALWLLAVVMGGSTLVSAGAAWLLQRALTRPLSTLAATVHRITEHGDHALRAPKVSGDEIGRLADDFNQMLDVLERQAAALRESEGRLSHVIDATNDAFWDWPLAGDRAYFSPRCYTMLGYEPGEFPASYSSWTGLLHPEDLAATEQVLQEHLQGRSAAFTAEYRMRRRDGGYLWILSRGRVVEWDPAGKPMRAAGTHTDVTARKQAEEEIRRLNEELEQRVVQRTSQLEAANQELEAFSYSVSHDLRAPLRAVDGYTRILQEDHSGALDPDAQRLCGLISQNARRMAQLIDDLLRFSRLSRARLNESTVDMGDLAQSVFDELAASEDRSRIEFRRAFLPVATGDAALLRQVWVNLLGNAVKYTAQRPVAVIEVGGTSDDSENTYWVRDNGAGFDMRYRHKLFGVFQRLHPESEFKGTGVGLAIVQRLILRHGGRVWAESQVNQGATFHFSLPRKDP